MYNIEGKVALITGGCGGIGLAYLEELLTNGVKGISVLDLNETIGRSIEKRFANGNDKRVIFIKTDICNKQEVENAFESTVKVFNQLDIVINNAGLLKPDDFEAMINVNLTAAIRISNLAISHYFPKYKSEDEGVIVNTASIAGLGFYPLLPVYSATKHGLVAFSKIVGAEYDKHKTRMLTICPGATDTPLFDVLFQFNIANGHKLSAAEMATQEPKQVGEALITVIKEGKSGSVWVSAHKPVYEIEVNGYL